ncbi:hypothetical protein [uncultured Brachyspira sp.]|uniref:hypothetical protein n=1 Tax=uncultured Brachyspira sp. TaxID=221953 RepID=UPI0025E61363|nr:hypothetical protein [uncultured Brachyspira sp.]
MSKTSRVILAKNNLHLLREQIGITYSDNQVIINDNEAIEFVLPLVALKEILELYIVQDSVINDLEELCSLLEAPSVEFEEKYNDLMVQIVHYLANPLIFGMLERQRLEMILVCMQKAFNENEMIALEYFNSKWDNR